MKIEIKVLNKEFYNVDKLGGSYYDLPQYMTNGSVAMDLCCTEDVTIRPGEVVSIHTGLAIWIGNDSNSPVAGLIMPRSGLGSKGLVLANTIGLIDSDYQGELIINAWNRNSVSVYKYSYNRMYSGAVENQDRIELRAGNRIAQLMFVPAIEVQWKEVDEFSNKTARGEGGFGSTNNA